MALASVCVRVRAVAEPAGGSTAARAACEGDLGTRAARPASRAHLTPAARRILRKSPKAPGGGRSRINRWPPVDRSGT